MHASRPRTPKNQPVLAIPEILTCAVHVLGQQLAAFEEDLNQVGKLRPESIPRIERIMAELAALIAEIDLGDGVSLADLLESVAEEDLRAN